MMKNMRRGIPNLFKSGTAHIRGTQEAVMKNIEACKDLATITRTSYGPNGMNKMIINYLEKLFVTSDAATMMAEMEVQHPAAKLLVLAARMQEREIGDGSNYVLVLAGELLKQARGLLELGLHPSEIIKGYVQAADVAMASLDELVTWKVEAKELAKKETIETATFASLCSKQLTTVDILNPLIADACMCVMPKNVKNFNVDNVRTCKMMGGSVQHSEVICGVVVNRDTDTSVKSVLDAKVAVFTCAIDTATTETKGTVLIKDADELLDYNKSEERMIEASIKAIADSGVKVIVTGGSVGDMAKHFVEKYGMMLIRILSKFELRRLAKTVKANMQVRLGAVPPEAQGYCAKAYVREVGLQKVTVFEQKKTDLSQIATIMLRGSTKNILNDIERAVDDGVNVIKSLVKDGRFLPGGGATEIELARKLAELSNKEKTLSQYAIKKFAQSFEIIPTTLAENAGLKPLDVLTLLYSEHESGKKSAGINIDAQDVKQSVKDLAKDRIFDSLPAKKMAIKLATDAAVTVLRVDQIIMAKPAGGPKMGQRKGHWDDQD
uniref:CCT-theta n=1 Tax=Bigelowiella natans TaxID=227086 RepID=Q7XBN9_BIGNA|nr:chaperonin-containing TCP-1 theta [Bigelowiella natans]